MEIDAKVITTVKIQFELTCDEWKLLERFIRHGPAHSAEATGFADDLVHAVRSEMHDKDL